MKGKTAIIFFSILTTALLFLNCGTPKKETNKSVIGTEMLEKASEENAPVILSPNIPVDAIVGDFNGDGVPFYSYIKRVDRTSGFTEIAFENNRYPAISLPKVYGAKLSKITLDGFNKDLLLVQAKIKDPDFNKYFLYKLRNSQWKPVMNGFAIHKDHFSDTLVPIRNNPENPNELIRYYSVFDLDASSELGYTWRLLEESIPIENR